jgi:undecaprenyl-diphosphatase
MIIQGIIQGLTEFLPVSSSGHLTLFQYFSGSESLEANIQTNIALHFGTLVAVIFFFRKDLIPFFTISGWKNKEVRKLALMIILGSIPTAVIGLSFKKQFENMFSNPSYASFFLFVTGLILLFAEKCKTNCNKDFSCKSSEMELEEENLSKELTPLKSISIGFVQGFAITPGISRSGSTIAAGLFAGMNGQSAARFSFLLMIPAVFGATLLEVKKFLEAGASAVAFNNLAIGALVSMLTGLAALKLLVFMIRKQKLSIFSYYLFAISIGCLIAINFPGK